MPATNLDMDVLRTLAIAYRLGSFNRAARQIGRSQSAVSQQIRKLEEQVGETLFHKAGRGLALTEAGEMVLAYARRILDLNDEVIAAVRGRAVDGSVRFGLPPDFAEAWLPAALGRFNRACPAVRIEATVDRNRRLLERLDHGELDLVLALGNEARADAQPVGVLPLVWIGPSSGAAAPRFTKPVPLATFAPPCFFRQHAIEALDRAGLGSRIAFTSPSLHGLWAAIEAGLGVTLRTATGLPPGLAALSEGAGLPAIQAPPLKVCLHDAGRQLAPALAALRSVLVETLQERLTP